MREVSTGSGGRYTAPLLRPGSYTVKIDANHFQTFEAEGIVLMAGQERHFDAQLKPEARDETVLLDEKSTPQQTHTGTVDGIVDFKRAWQDAPFVDLHPSALPLLTQAPATQGNTLGNQTGLVISGVSARNQQTWALNGVAQNPGSGSPLTGADYTISGQPSLTPSPRKRPTPTTPGTRTKEKKCQPI